jgi:cbb3-type cytochrome oxidase subunit 3
MRNRGIFIALLSLLPLVLAYRSSNRLIESPFGSEYGSVAFPIPRYIRVEGILGIVLLLLGIGFIAYDFIDWRKKKRHDATS